MDEFATRMGLQFEFAEQTRAEPLGNMGIWNCSGRRGTDDKTLMTISSSLPHRLIGVAKEKKKILTAVERIFYPDDVCLHVR